ncbi:MAG: hypothetical protein ACLGGX_02765 [Bdellovibrionia bacterium]
MFKSIGKNLKWMIVLGSLVVSTLASAQASRDGDSWVPWPWGLEAPFPWRDIHGLWSVTDDGQTTYFGFKIVREKTTKGRQLFVKQMDADGCKVVATGVGYENDNIISAVMSGTNGIFKLTLRAFAAEDSPVPPAQTKFQMNSVMVLTIDNLDWDGQEIHMPLTKVADSVAQKACLEIEKNKK